MCARNTGMAEDADYEDADYDDLGLSDPISQPYTGPRDFDPDVENLLGPDPDPNAPKLTSRQIQELARRRAWIGSGRIKGGKCTPARMMALCSYLEQMPVIAEACRMNNIHPTTVKLWLVKSERGAPGDAYDLCFNPDDPEEDRLTLRFHEAFESAIKTGLAKVEVAAMERSLGYQEPLTHGGHVMYKPNFDAIAEGKTGKEAFELDANGKPIVESVTKQDPDMIRFILKANMPEKYGNKQQIDVTHRGGVLVVGARAPDSKALEAVEQKMLEAPIDVEFEEVPEDE